MSKSSIEEQIQARLEAFAVELSGLVRAAALEAVEEALVGKASSPAPARTRRTNVARRARPTAAKGKRVRRTALALEQDMDALLAHVAAHPGQRLEEISSGLRIVSKDLKRPVTLLLKKRKIRKEGKKRGTRYFATAKGAGGSSKKKASKKRKKKSVGRKKAARK